MSTFFMLKSSVKKELRQLPIKQVVGERKHGGDASRFLLFLYDWAVLLLSCFSPTREKKEIVGVPASSRDPRWVSGQRGRSVPPGASIGGVRLAGLQPAQDPLWSADSRMQTDGAAPKLLWLPASPHGLRVAETPSRNHQLSGESFWSKRSGLSTYAHIPFQPVLPVWVDLEWNLHCNPIAQFCFCIALHWDQFLDMSFICDVLHWSKKKKLTLTHMLHCSIQLRTGCFRMMTLSLVATHPEFKNYKILILNNNLGCTQTIWNKKMIWQIFNDNWDCVKSQFGRFVLGTLTRIPGCVCFCPQPDRKICDGAPEP